VLEGNEKMKIAGVEHEKDQEKRNTAIANIAFEMN
jgi:hypothetical protein